MPTARPAHLYVLRLTSGALYIGVTKDPPRRLTEHFTSHGTGRTTSGDPPAALAYSERHETMHAARIRERQLKHWSRTKKEALISGDVVCRAHPGDPRRSV